MKEKTCQTRCGTIHYWASVSNPDTITLVLLPGLTADHRLFDKQIQYFEEKYNYSMGRTSTRFLMAVSV